MLEDHERTPLLGHAAEDNKVQGESDRIELGQVAILCLVRLLDSLAFFSIFAFVNNQVNDSGVPEKSVGLWSGMIESSFSVAQMVFNVPASRLSDKYGRKPMLVASLWGMGACVALYGFSNHVGQMIVLRAAMGCFASSATIVRTSLAELSNDKTQARVFAYFGSSSNLSMLLGPLIGGALSRPAQQYPGLFGHSQLLKQYPYCLSGLLCGAYAVAIALLTTFAFKETRQLESADNRTVPSISFRQLVRIKGVKRVLGLNATIWGLAYAYTPILPLFAFTGVRYGGLGFSPAAMSMLMIILGATQFIWLLVVFPRFERRIGTAGVIRYCCYYWPVILLAHGFVSNAIAERGSSWAVWAWLSLLLTAYSGITLAFSAITLAVNRFAPSSAALSSLNALATSVTCIVRVFTPALSTIIYAAGVQVGGVAKQLGWAVIAAVALAQIPLAMRLPLDARNKAVVAVSPPTP